MRPLGYLKNMQPTLFLIPTPLGSPSTPCLLPQEQALLAGLTDFVVEAEKTARACLRHFGLNTPLQQLNLRALNKHTAPDELPGLLQPLRQGRSMGLLSEAGCPAVADPGAALVALAHQAGFAVWPLVGPSSLMLALMASGANGQQFAFRGYLPADPAGRQGYLKTIEHDSRSRNESQIFIETPYRNNALLADAVATLHPDTLLCAASNLTLPEQRILSMSAGRWRTQAALPDLHKQPTVFVLYAGQAPAPARKRR